MKNIAIYPSLITAKTQLYAPNKLTCSNISNEPEGKAYDACKFTINSKSILFRSAKTTPIKAGFFVAIWKRVDSGPTLPYDTSDPFDLFIIHVAKEAHVGQFIFPKHVLCQRGLVSTQGKGGKRGIRVYAPWDKPQNAHAKKTQLWQLNYFVDYNSHNSETIAKLQKLFS